MYGLKEAGIIACKALIKQLAPYGYQPVWYTLEIWTYVSKNIKLTLAVDDFSIKYDNKADVEHLFHALRDKYNISIDWTGRHYCGLNIDCCCGKLCRYRHAQLHLQYT